MVLAIDGDSWRPGVDWSHREAVVQIPSMDIGDVSRMGDAQGEEGLAYQPLWPNLTGLELAPTTAKNGAVKNFRAAASLAMTILGVWD